MLAKAPAKILLIIFFILNLNLPAQSLETDSTKMILDKKVTITFKDKITLQKGKKVPELKIIKLAPEKNPITYNKTAFYSSIKTKQSKSLKQLFSYPLITANIEGGNNSSFDAGFNFQVNAKKFLPSLNWNYEHIKSNKENSAQKQIAFSGGFRFHATKNIDFNINAEHYQNTGNDFNYSFNPETTNFKSYLMNLNFGSTYKNENFSFLINTSTKEFSHEYQNPFKYFESKINYQTHIVFNNITLFGEGSTVWIENKLDDNKTDYANFSNQLGIIWHNNHIKLNGGINFFSDKNISSTNNSWFILPTFSANWNINPQFQIFSGYKSHYEQPNLYNLTNNYLYSAYSNLYPTLIKQKITAGLQITPKPSFILKSWFSHSKYENYSFWTKKDPASLYISQTINGDSAKVSENSINALVDFSIKNLKIIGGFNFYFKEFSKQNSLSEYLIPNKSFYATAFYQHKKIKIKTELNFEGGRKFLNNKGDKNILLLHTMVSYPVYKSFRATLKIKNLFNQKYSLLPGFEQPGITGNLGLKYKF